MKTTNQLGLVLLLAMVTSVATNAATPTDTVLAITRSDVKYLTYYDIVNHFDSVAVRFTYGELLLVNGASRTRIYPTSVRKPNDWLDDTSTAALQTMISNDAKWNAVAIPAGQSTLQFFRMASISNCFPVSESNPAGKSQAWSIGDRTLVYLVARDFTNDTIVFVADNIGVDSCNSSAFPCYLGQNPYDTYHSVPIPPTAAGKTVYFELQPWRYGSTPFGLSLVNSRSDIALSLIHRNDTLGLLDMDEIDSLNSRRIQKYMVMVDYLWEAFCFVPHSNEMRFTSAEIDTIHARYFQPDTVLHGKLMMVPKNCVGDSCGTFSKAPMKDFGSAHVHLPIAGKLDVINVKVDRPYVTLLVQTTKRIVVRVSAFDALGRELVALPFQVLQPGLSELNVDLSKFGNSIALIGLIDSNSNVVGTAKIGL